MPGWLEDGWTRHKQIQTLFSIHDDNSATSRGLDNHVPDHKVGGVGANLTTDFYSFLRGCLQSRTQMSS